MHLKLTEQSHRCGVVLVVSMMDSYKKKYCIHSKDMCIEFQGTMQGALSRQITKGTKLSGKCLQPVYPAALQLECAQVKLMG
jgi:hypothetical protein